MKYYYYISDAKVNMLLPQIGDGKIKRISRSLGLDFRFFSAKREVEYEVEDRIARLEKVVSYIREFGNLGTVEAPDEYIEDSLPMNFLVLEPGTIAYFTGRQGETVIGMGGSMKHLIGGEASASITVGGSDTHAILAALAESGIRRPTANDKWSALSEVKNILEWSQSRYPLENLRFMAKRLFVENNGSVILATPLYVTKED